MRKLVTALVLLFACSPIFGQVLTRTRNYADLGTCNASKNGRVTIIEDASTAGVCGSGGTEIATCWCINGTWESNPELGAIDLSGYVPVTKAGQQSITATGAGNDITLTAADDVVLSPAGTFDLNALIYDVTVTDGTGETCYEYAEVYDSTSTIDKICVADTNSSIILSARHANIQDQATLELGGAEAASYAQLLVRENNVTTAKLLLDQDSIDFDVADGADELVLSDDAVTVGDEALFYPATASAPPVACAGGTAGGMYYDTDVNELCICNGTSWLQVDDMTTGCS